MIHVISGAPCSGKSTYMRTHAAPGANLVDFDTLNQAFGGAEHAQDKKELTLRARAAAIDYIIEHADEDSWVIDTRPTAEQRGRYEAAGAEFIVLEADEATCRERAAADGRPQATLDAISNFFAKGGKMQTKAFDLIVDEQDDLGEGEILAYASTFDRIPDSYGDVVAPGAFAKTLADWAASGNPIPLLFGHRTDDPRMNIGKIVEATEDERGLRVRAKFDESNEVAAYTRKLVMEGRLSKLSFAYDTIDSAPVVLEDGTRARELRELKLFEVSLVPIPANPLTEVIDAKDAPEGLTNEEFRAMREDPAAFYAADENPVDEKPVDETPALDAETKRALLDIVSVMDLAWSHAVEAADDILEERLGIKSEDAEEKAAADELADAIDTISTLAGRLDDIADMIDDMVKRIAALAELPAGDAAKQEPDIEAKQAEDEADETSGNAEDPDEGNAEAEAKKAAVLARMARYIDIKSEEGQDD